MKTPYCTSDVVNGAALDTSSPGLKSFTVEATDALGNMTSRLVLYSVSLGTAIEPFAGLTAWLPGDGTPADAVTADAGGVDGNGDVHAGKVAEAFSVGGGNALSFAFVQPGPFTLQAWVRTPDRLQPWSTGVLSTGGPGQESATLQLELDGAGNYVLNAGNSDLPVVHRARDRFLPAPRGDVRRRDAGDVPERTAGGLRRMGRHAGRWGSSRFASGSTARD